MLLPFTYPWIIRHHFGHNKTILDLGAGDGSFMKTINKDKKFEVVGIELFEPYIKKAKKTKVYKDVVKGNVTRLGKFTQAFEVVHASQVIEHLTRSEAKDFLRTCDNVASRKIIIGTPNGHFHQEEYDDNIHQEHKSQWTVQDFKKLKFKVYGQGLKKIYGEKGLIHHPLAKIVLLKKILFLLSYCSSPFVYYFPNYAAHLIATKEK